MVEESFEGLKLGGGKQRKWAEDLLTSRLSALGGGMAFSRHLSGLMGVKGYPEFKKRWLEWWNKVGKVKYAKELEEEEKWFQKTYVKVDGVYVQRSQRFREVEGTLTWNEIRWLKKKYRNRRECAF